MANPAYYEIARTEVEHQHPVILMYNGIWYQVHYGESINRRLNYHQAASQFGYAVMHAASCNGHTID